VTEDTAIYVDAVQPATLNDGAGKLTDYGTVQEAVEAWHALPSAHKIRATVKVFGGPVYNAHQIPRLHYGPKPSADAPGAEVDEWRGRANRTIRWRSRPPRISPAKLSEFGYRETDDPDEADRRRFSKVEKWDAAAQRVEHPLFEQLRIFDLTRSARFSTFNFV
jgi:hypothetical protein